MAAFIAPILSGLTGLFGGSAKKQTDTTTNQTTNQAQQGQFANQSSTTPNLNPFQQQLAQLFTTGAINQYNQNTNLAPYTSQGLQQIQSGGAQNEKAISNNLAARGLSYSPAAANGLIQNQLNTGGQMNTFLQGIPLLQKQLQQGNLQQLMQAFSTMPTGVSTTGSGTTSSTGTSNTQGTSHQVQSTPGGALAGALSGLTSGLLAPGKGGNSNLSNILGGGGGGNSGGGGGEGLPVEPPGFTTYGDGQGGVQGPPQQTSVDSTFTPYTGSGGGSDTDNGYDPTKDSFGSGDNGYDAMTKNIMRQKFGLNKFGGVS